ncbi:MAG: tyrosine-type recombinase/integrase [Gammaproteobacteria bacterium]
MDTVRQGAFADRRLPTIVANADRNADLAFLEFFTARIRNPNTRAAYHRAVRRFFAWCQDNGLGLAAVQPVHVATYIEAMTAEREPQTVKQHLAAIRMLFDWFVIRQVVPSNPTAPVKGPRYSVRVGKTPVLSATEARQLLDSIETGTAIGRRDRALIALMIYTFARVGAAVAINIGDLFVQEGHPWVRLREKGGRDHAMPLHPELEATIGLYLGGMRDAAPDLPLFRAACGRAGTLTLHRLDRRDAWAMVQRRANAAGLTTHATCHSFRATGITAFLKNGGTLDAARLMAAHASARTTTLYDRRLVRLCAGEIARIALAITEEG